MKPTPMHFKAAALAVVVVCLFAHTSAAQMPVPTEPPTPPAGAAGACTIAGPVLGPTDFGIAAGQPLADGSAVLLPDGRVRMYIFAQGRGIVSAVSLTTEGVSFAAEPGNRLPDGSGMPRAVVNPDGG
jgi:hypothetical protein